MAVLRLEKVTKTYSKRGYYPTHALNGIDLQTESGEFVGIMGPSGSGKTTLLNILSGIDRPTAGSVEICGRNLAQLSNTDLALFRRQRLGFIFQDFNLLDSLTVRENILLPMILDKRDQMHMDSKAREIMTFFRIEEISSKYPYEISGGEQQRAAVCRAIANDPGIILADEPTGNLDSKSASAVMHSFQALHGQGRTILMVTHDAFAASFCKKVVLIRDGTVRKEVLAPGSQHDFFDLILENVEIYGAENNDP
jgi:putative ABC transport system ATP-binding protein